VPAEPHADPACMRALTGSNAAITHLRPQSQHRQPQRAARADGCLHSAAYHAARRLRHAPAGLAAAARSRVRQHHVLPLFVAQHEHVTKHACWRAASYHPSGPGSAVTAVAGPAKLACRPAVEVQAVSRLHLLLPQQCSALSRAGGAVICPAAPHQLTTPCTASRWTSWHVPEQGSGAPA